jgi:hypothetical protein
LTGQKDCWCTDVCPYREEIRLSPDSDLASVPDTDFESAA